MYHSDILLLFPELRPLACPFYKKSCEVSSQSDYPAAILIHNSRYFFHLHTFDRLRRELPYYPLFYQVCWCPRNWSLHTLFHNSPAADRYWSGSSFCHSPEAHRWPVYLWPRRHLYSIHWTDTDIRLPYETNCKYHSVLPRLLLPAF